MTAERDQHPVVPAPAVVPRRRFQVGLVLAVMLACGLSVAVDLVTRSDLRWASIVIRSLFFLLLGAFVLGLTHSSGLWRLGSKR